MRPRVRILIVDNEPDFIEPVAFWLTTRGYHVLRAGSGEAALAMIQEEPPDVVFLDIRMPGLDGLETLRRLQTFNTTLPVIMITATPDDIDKFAGARGLGIAGFFPKRGSLSQLGDTLEVTLRMLRRSHLIQVSWMHRFLAFIRWHIIQRLPFMRSRGAP